jgi:hypothetical protein
MVVWGLTGPVVLLGVSLSSQDESVFFRGIVQLSNVVGSTPSRLLSTVAALMVKRTALSAERKRELQEDFGKNVPQDIMRALREYVRWLHRQALSCRGLCRARFRPGSSMPKNGDGGLTDDERAPRSKRARIRTW